MIYYSVPYSSTKNIGKYYNDFMKILPNDDDFACFVDGDTIFTTSNYGHTIERAVEKNPEVGCFTCYTNRVACTWQIAPGVNTESNDMSYHRKFGESMQLIYGTKCTDVTDVDRLKVMSGVLILLQKRVWKKIGGFIESGMLGVDNDLHWKLQDNNEKLFLMNGLYLYHWYRGGNKKDISHLI